MKRAIVVAGLVLVGFSILAKQLGIDNDDGWGIGRTAILAAGLALVASGLIAFRNPEAFSKLGGFMSEKKYLGIAGLLVVVIYAWVSQVNINFLRTDYHYYSELARSFKNGQLHLAEQPSEALLALADPYDYDLRVASKVEDFPWDVSLYKQKFYLYYGPVPALFLSILPGELLAEVGDRYLVIVFALGLFLYGLCIINNFFTWSIPNAPGWLAGLCVLTFGLSAPSAIMVQESRLYQVAVFGAQFFFIGGCFWIYSAIAKNGLDIWKLALAGVHWALALGTRSSIAPMILFAAAAAIITVWRLHTTSLREMLLPTLAIGIPLLVAAVSLAWYNWARFDSVIQFGMIYTLTDINYPKANDIFALKHIGRNAYFYFLHPLRLSSHFPYLIRIEYPVSNERLGGFLYIAPYVLFALLPIVSSLRKVLTPQKIAFPLSNRINAESWLLVTLAGAALIGMFTILSFWTVQLRYTEDFMPSLLLFASAHVGKEHQQLEGTSHQRKLFSSFVILLACTTVVASTLVALKSNSLGFWVNLIDSLLRILNLK